MYIFIVSMLLLIFISGSYITFQLEIIMADSERFKGIQIRCGLPLYSFEQIYNQNDSPLSLWPALLLDRWVKSTASQNNWNWERIKNIFMMNSTSHLFSTWEQQSFYILKKALGYAVIKRIVWQSRVGGGDAMWTALRTGMWWAIMGWGITFLANISRLQKACWAVEPDYCGSEFNSRIDCIIKMRIVHIITIVFYLIAWKVRWWLNGFAANTGQQPSY